MVNRRWKGKKKLLKRTKNQVDRNLVLFELEQAEKKLLTGMRRYFQRKTYLYREFLNKNQSTQHEIRLIVAQQNTCRPEYRNFSFANKSKKF